MLLRFPILWTSLSFALMLELSLLGDIWSWYMAAVVLLWTLRAAYKVSGMLVSASIPVLLGLSSVTLLYLVDTSAERQGVIFLVTCAYYLAFLGIYRLRYAQTDQTARGMVAFALASSMFLFYSSVYGVYLNFAVSIGTLMAAYCLGTTLASYQYFCIVRREDAGRTSTYSLVLGLIAAEIAWVVNFWPFGYLTTGVVALAFYFLLWSILQEHLLGVFTHRRLMIYAILVSILIGMVLLSARWTSLV